MPGRRRVYRSVLVAGCVSGLALAILPLAETRAAPFLRGDSNQDQAVDVSDAVATLAHLFLGGRALPCLDAADANDDGKVDISDPVKTLQHLFTGGDALPPPQDAPGEDPSADALGCGVPFERIQMRCMDLIGVYGFLEPLEAVVRTQQEYEELIHERFQKILDDYWNAHYAEVKARIQEQYPGIPPEHCERRVKEYFYSRYPFKGTEGCTHPEIDFAEHTLLGQDANWSGCSPPETAVEVLADEAARTFTFHVLSRQNGHCEVYIFRNIWILVPRIPPSYGVVFQNEYFPPR